MSSTATRIPLAEASEIAEQLTALIALSCERVLVAGSIRRQSPTCGDIDLLCEPKVEPLVDMFGEPIGEDIDRLHNRLCDLERLTTIDKRRDVNGRTAWGTFLKRAVFRGVAVDIRACRDRENWGLWALISTGPAAFNKALVTPRHQGGWLPPGFEIKDGFKLFRAGGRILTPREEDVFEALGIPYLAPADRAAVAGGAAQ